MIIGILILINTLTIHSFSCLYSVRSNGSEIHNIASLIGGMASQEALKVCYHRLLKNYDNYLTCFLARYFSICPIG